MIIVPEKEALIRKFAGRKIRFYRKKAKMTQDEFGIRLAKELGKRRISRQQRFQIGNTEEFPFVILKQLQKY